LRRRDIEIFSYTGEAIGEHRAVRTIDNFCLIAVEKNVNDIDVEDIVVDIAKMKIGLLV